MKVEKTRLGTALLMDAITGVAVAIVVFTGGYRSINYDLEVLRNQRYSYKDEIALACVILPFIGNFIPGLQDYVLRGWEYLAKAPEWYSYIFIGAISASLGIRFLTKKMFK